MMKTGACLAAVVLAACATYQPRPVSAAANAEAIAARTLDGEAVRALVAREHPEASWPPARWTPESLALAAIALHPDLDVARAEWNLAKAALRTAGERPNPTASAGIERISAGDANSWTATLALELPIETAGKRGARVAQAKALTAAAAADADQAIWNVRTRAAGATIDLAASERISAIRARETAVRDEIVAMLEKRLEAGEASQPEVTRARSEARSARALQLAEEGRTAQGRSALAAAIGIPTAALPSLDLDPLASVPASIGDEPRLRERALTARPDILAALARHAAAEEALRLEIRRQYPDIRVGPGIGWDQGAFKWTASLAAELPLFNRHEGPIAEAVARREAEAARVFAAQARVLGDLEAALTSARGARARLDEAERVLASRRAQAASALKQFQAGEIDRLALRNQELEVTLAEADRWAALFDLRRSAVALESAVEQPLGALR